MSVNTILWDWNGTLLDDAALCLAIVNRLLREQQLPPLDLPAYRDVFDFPVRAYYQRIGFDYDRESFESLTARFIEQYRQEVVHCHLQAGVCDWLETFRQRGAIQYILTAAQSGSVRTLLRHFAIEKYFRDIAGLDNHHADDKTGAGKALLKRHAIDPGCALLIGDTVHDAEVATALGVKVVLIARGHQSADKLYRMLGDRIPIYESLSTLGDKGLMELMD